MQKIIGVTELQRRFRSVFDEVAQDGIPFVLTRNSRPEVVLIPYEDFLRYQRLEEQEVLARFDRLVVRMAERNADYGEDEVAEAVAAARKELKP